MAFSNLMHRVATIGFVVFLMAPALAAAGSSYDEVRNRIFAEPLEELPHYRVRPSFQVQMLLALMRIGGHDLASRLRGTVSDPSDFKEAKPKIIHSMGVCAEAIWRVDATSGVTGLFETGTETRAIVRFSTGNNATLHHAKKPRMMGMAVKLFPAQDADAKVMTRNVFTLDQHGLDGSTRKSYFFTDGNEKGPVVFSNSVEASSPAAKVAIRLFGRFDRNPGLRPLYALAEVTGDGREVANPMIPERILFIPRQAKKLRPIPADFRSEVLSYQPGELVFDVVLPSEGMMPEAKMIGTLTLGRSVVSVACDQELHFHHHPTR